MARRKAGDNKVRVGNVSRVSGKVIIAGGDIYEGYTVEQVSLLLKEITTNYRRKPFTGHCPYKGLEVFEEEDADLFFGRERLVEDLLSRVKESRTVFITGPSGSGKSSLVRAGLIHALKDGALKSSDHWLYETMKPGREPIKELSLAFSRLKSPELAHYFQDHASDINILNECAESVLSGRKDRRFVLFVDQFEEVFTQINQEEERQAFLNMLAHAGTLENGRVIILFAMRSDFVSNCATYPAINELLSQEFRQIGAMQPEELVSAIALPAKEVGLPFEEELIARIINDMKGEPGALPLMQFALKDLFDSQQEKGGVIALTLEDYLRHGGIQKSLQRHADASLAALDEKSQDLARSIFSGLIEIGRGTQDTKRTALFEELVPANAAAEDVQDIVQRLADARLIITDEQAGKDTVTISHEKLIEAWPWLKKLVNENRDVIALQNEISADAKEWEDHGRDASYLYMGARLINAREQLEKKNLVLSSLAQEFVRAGRTRQQRSQMALVAGISAVIVLLFLAVVIFRNQSRANANIASTAQAANTEAVSQKATAQAASTVAVEQAEKTEKQLRISRASELAAQALEMQDKDFQLSSLLALEAFYSADTVRARGALLNATNANPQLLRFLMGHTDPIRSIAFSPDGKMIASGSSEGAIILWDVQTQQAIDQPLIGHTDLIPALAFSSDSKILASGSWDKTIILWDVGTHQPIGQPLIGHTGRVTAIAFRQGDKTIASGSEDGTVILWNIGTHQPMGQPLARHTESVYGVAFSPDGRILASGSSDSTIILWDVETHQPMGQPLAKHTGFVLDVAFSPDGKTLASGSYDSTVILWDVETHQPMGQLVAGDRNSVYRIAFSRDGKLLAAGTIFGEIILWNVESRQPVGQPLTGHTSSVEDIAFSPDGQTIASGSDDRAIILWDVEARQPISQLLSKHTGSVESVAFSPNGKFIASGSQDNTIILWDVKTHQPIKEPLSGHTDVITSLAFSPDSRILASGSEDNTIILWDVETHQPIGKPLARHTDRVFSVAFSPDGTMLASGSWDGTIILWEVGTLQPIGQPLTGRYSVFRIAFSPNGKILASAGLSGTIILWNVESRQPVGQLVTRPGGSIRSLAFSPDNKVLASGDDDYVIILWDLETRQPIGQPLTGHTSSVYGLAFSPDGKTLASGSNNGEIRLWEVESHQQIGKPLFGHTNGLAFSPDGTMLVSGRKDSSVILWQVSSKYWIEQSCQRVGRNFSRAEWERYFPNETYRKTCTQWPLEPQVTVAPSPTP